MTASARPRGQVSAWRVAVIGAVAALAVGIGAAAGSFLLVQRTAAVGAGADYVPADAPFFVELRVEPSEGQDAALRDLLGHFPAMEGIDLAQPLHPQLTLKLDEMLLAEGADVTWADDVAPWFDGHVAMALTAWPETPTDPMAVPPIPPFVVLFGVTDHAAAEAAIDRLLTEADAPGFTDEEHAGVTIRSATTGEGAYALTADQLVLGSSADDIRSALDTHAAGTGTLAELADMTRLIEQLPEDWLAFVSYDMTDLMAQAFSEAGAVEPDLAAALESLMEHQSLRGAMAMSASGDRLVMDAATDAPTGPFALVNEDRGLADEVPSDTLYYSDAGNVGAALAGVIGPLKEAAAATPEAAEQLRIAEAAVGGDFEELVSWIDDAAIVVGYDGAAPYGGLVLVPNDVDAAQRRISQLGSFAALAAMDPSSGISTDERDVAGVTVTTIRWAPPDEATAFMMPIPGGVSLEYAVTEDRALIGIGEAFVGRVLELDASASLASQARYTDAVASLGGAENAGVTWLDLAGTLAAVEEALGPMLGSGEDGVYEAEVRPWLAPLDRVVSVSRLEGDVLVQRAALLVE